MGSPIPAMGSPIPAMCSPSSAKWWSEGGIPASLQRSVGGDAADAGRPVGRDAGAPGGGTGCAGARWRWAGRTSRSRWFGAGLHDAYTERLDVREEAAVKVLAAMSGGVDSAVAAARAAEAGHEVVGVHMALSKNRDQNRTGSRGCCTVEDAS